MSWLSQFLHPSGGYDAAGKTVEKYANEGKGVRQPYIQGGQDAYTKLMEAITNLQNPTKLRDEWGKTYNESDTAKANEAAAKERSLESASANGLIGSSAAQANMTTATTDIANADKEKYMKDMMEQYLNSIGITKDIFNTGAQTANNQANASENTGKTMGDIEYGKNTAGGEMFGNLGKGALDLITRYLTGGMGGGGAWTPSSGGK